MRNITTNLKPFELLSYTSWIITIVAMLIWWRIGTYAIALQTLVVVVRCIVERRIGNPTLENKQRFCLWLMILYWIIYIASALYSTDQHEAWSTVATKIPFFLFALLCLCDDTRYLSHNHIRGLFYTIAIALSIRFIAATVASFVSVAQGTTLSKAFFWQFDPFGLHHSYLSLYIVIVLAFLYTEIQHHWHKQSTHWKLFIIAIAAILFIYMMIGNSRAGIVATGALILAITIHTTFIQKQWRYIPLIIGGTIVIFFATSIVLPTTLNRFTKIIHEIQAGRPANERIIMAQYVFEAIENHWIFGHGSGDYMPVLLDIYVKHDFTGGIKLKLGSHNQYLETLMETGIIGVIIFLAMMLAPLLTALRRNRHHLLTAMETTVIMSIILFESMFNRQMGIQMATVCYCLMILDSRYTPILAKTEQTKQIGIGETPCSES